VATPPIESVEKIEESPPWVVTPTTVVAEEKPQEKSPLTQTPPPFPTPHEVLQNLMSTEAEREGK
jgi:hypothetical protein